MAGWSQCVSLSAENPAGGGRLHVPDGSRNPHQELATGGTLRTDAIENGPAELSAFLPKLSCQNSRLYRLGIRVSEPPCANGVKHHEIPIQVAGRSPLNLAGSSRCRPTQRQRQQKRLKRPDDRTCSKL